MNDIKYYEVFRILMYIELEQLSWVDPDCKKTQQWIG